jgi:dCTP deaminase
MEAKTTELFSPESVHKNASGVLPYQALLALIEQKIISAPLPFGDDQIQPASMDLRLGTRAYRVEASFLPGAKSTVKQKIDELKVYELDLTNPTVLETGHIYIVPLLEEVRLPPNFYGKANPKSTTGRLDLFTRLITDYCTEYEFIDTEYAGPLYVEIVPIHFSVVVQAGTKLNQLRIIHGTKTSLDVDVSDTTLKELDKTDHLVYIGDQGNARKASVWDGLMLSIDLKGTDPGDIIGYRARKNTQPIDLAKIGHYSPDEYWEAIRNDRKTLILQPDGFYILASKEKVRVPPDFAARLVETDPSYGEFRVHYAGFFDPGFGYGRNDVMGTRAVLEVRCHEVPFQLEDGQVIGRLKYERLTERPTRIYGVDIGSSYQRQDVALSKQFKKAR